MTQGMGSHQSATMTKDEWLTPPSILMALGQFDLDPCSPIVRKRMSGSNMFGRLMRCFSCVEDCSSIMCQEKKPIKMPEHPAHLWPTDQTMWSAFEQQNCREDF